MKENSKKIFMIIAVISLIIVITIIIRAVFFIKNKDKVENSLQNNEIEQTETEEIQREPGEFETKGEDGRRINNSEKISSKEIDLDGLKINNLKISSQSTQTQLLADVTNTTSTATELTFLTITLLDKEGNEIAVLDGVVKALEPGEKIQMNANIDVDCSNAFDLRIEK